jgi:DNA-binding MarR family transcriptional regulator
MMIEGRPLYDNSADGRLFVAPSEWEALMRAVDRHLNVLVAAPRGWGKTSLLRQAQLTLRLDGGRVAFVDASAVEDGEELLRRARRALVTDPSPPRRDAGTTSGELGAMESVPQTTILVDASHSAGAVYSLFGRLRDAIWQLPHRWVVAVNVDEEATALKPPADAFFDVVLRVDRWSRSQLEELLKRRVQDDRLDDLEVEELVTGSNGNPRRALRAVSNALVTGRKPSASLSDQDQLLESAAELGRPHALLMAELLDLGQASPSDPVLLERLGLTRGRVTALLRDLLERRLVEAAPDTASNRAGRPRMLYRPSAERENP